MADWGLVTLNDIELDTIGRTTQNSHVLTNGAPKRFKNQIRPGVDGVKGSRGYKRDRTVDLDVWLDGMFDLAGDPAEDPIEAVEAHIRYLRAQILEDPGDDEGCVPVEVTTPTDGVTHEGMVQVVDMVADPGIGARVVTFELTIIGGALEIIGGS